nr:hypothetical protein [Burkholderia ubonensis]
MQNIAKRSNACIVAKWENVFIILWLSELVVGGAVNPEAQPTLLSLGVILRSCPVCGCSGGTGIACVADQTGRPSNPVQSECCCDAELDDQHLATSEILKHRQSSIVVGFRVHKKLHACPARRSSSG